MFLRNLILLVDLVLVLVDTTLMALVPVDTMAAINMARILVLVTVARIQTLAGQGGAAGGANWQQPASSASNIDAMMDDLEKKALRKEIEELRTKLAKHEKGEF